MTDPKTPSLGEIWKSRTDYVKKQEEDYGQKEKQDRQKKVHHDASQALMTTY